MEGQYPQRIALVGNPNSGKSSIFNLLTGLKQKTANFPGITVDKKIGYMRTAGRHRVEVIDLPGTYSLYPKSLDERIVLDTLTDKEGKPNLVLIVADASNLKRNLLLFTQVKDLDVPCLLVLNMMDILKRSGQEINLDKLSGLLKVPIVTVNGRTGQGLDELKATLQHPHANHTPPIFEAASLAKTAIAQVKDKFHITNDYEAWQLLQQNEYDRSLKPEERLWIADIINRTDFKSRELQKKETIARYAYLDDVLLQSLPARTQDRSSLSQRLDKLITHKVWGYLIFFALLTLIFQAIFAWATVPMDWIDLQFALLSGWLADIMPPGVFTDLLTEGVVPGIGGVVIFIPQIAILFAFISVLEETGYMSRVVFLMDKIMRKFGLNGKSVVPLISGMACAIPAIMATRTIDNWKDRLITIFVTPLMSCSARLPIYTIVIALIVPDKELWGFINWQGLALMGMYLLGFLAAVLSAAAMRMLIKTEEKSYLIMELPHYKIPRWANVGFTIYEKTKTFVFEAGKVILAIAVVLWVLASYGPSDKMEKAEQVIAERYAGQELDEAQFQNEVASYKLEYSYAGIFGKALEPTIRPLGFDWKMGIALLTSFAAREVFVGTMATIYSIGDGAEETTIKSRMKAEINPETGGPRYTLAVGLSLLVFYAFAMQCMSTVAVVYRETKGWKWPILQLVYMTVLAYVSAFVVYQVLS